MNPAILALLISAGVAVAWIGACLVILIIVRNGTS